MEMIQKKKHCQVGYRLLTLSVINRNNFKERKHKKEIMHKNTVVIICKIYAIKLQKKTKSEHHVSVQHDILHANRS